MFCSKATPTILALILGFQWPFLDAHAQINSSLYEISSGRYLIIGGLVPLTIQLPNEQQGFVELRVDADNQNAQLDILSLDRQTVFLRLTNGLVSGNGIRFVSMAIPHSDGIQDQEFYDYTVTNLVDSIQLNGLLQRPFVCCDIPNRFVHTNVVAHSIPSLIIRVSEVEICWPSRANRTYQVQYKSNLTTNSWVDLGAPVTGNGTTNCVTDPVPAGEPRRFYRVVTLP